MSRALDAVPEGPQDVLAALDAGLEAHHAWLAAWHRALVCQTVPDPDVVADDPVAACPFGRWLGRHGEEHLLRQPAFADLKNLHGRARDLGKLIAERAAAGKPVPALEYDALIEVAERFETVARRLRDAFRKAVAELDPLTGLANRVTMLRELEAELERAGRTGQPCGIALADIDRFKAVNDTHGHTAGDKVLAAAAGRFLSHLRPYDTIYRYGGEEFLICLPNADAATARVVLERLRETLAGEPVPVDAEMALSVTASFGLAMARDGAGLKTLIERADAALYDAKRAGRDRVVTWLPPDAEKGVA